MAVRNKRLYVTLGLCGLVVLLGVVEAVARARSRRDQGADWAAVRERMAMTPYTQFGFAPYDRAAVDRSPYFGDRPWPADRPLTVILGGSTAAGAKASDYEHTFFRQAAAATGLEIVSAAHPAHVSGQELVMLALHVLPRHPERVVLVSGLNDVYAPAVFGTPPGYPTNWRLVQWLFQSPGNSLAAWLGQKSALANLLLTNAVQNFDAETDARTSGRRAIHPVQLSAVLDAWETNLRAMAALARGAQMELIFVAQPNGVLAGATLPPPYDRPEHAAYLERSWPQFIAHARQVCASESVRFVDATLAVAPEHFLDPAHFGDAGHAALGALLASVLQPAARPPLPTAATAMEPAPGPPAE